MPRRLIARKSFSYGGKWVAAGQAFNASAQDAKVLTALGRAASAAHEAAVDLDTSFEAARKTVEALAVTPEPPPPTPEPEPVVPTPEPEPIPEPAAEPFDEPADTPAEAVETSTSDASKSRPYRSRARRTYHRQDMTAERADE